MVRTVVNYKAPSLLGINLWKVVESMDLESKTWIRVLVFPLTGFVTVSKLFNPIK
jgi:hypothetical protein